MNIGDDDGADGSGINFTNCSLDDNTYMMNDSESDDDNCKFNSSLEWQCAKSPFESLVFGWGNTVDGELGLGGIEEHYILSPRQVSFHDSGNVKYVACGEHHSLVLTYNGMVYSCGNNDFGQLGRPNSRTKLQKVDGLEFQNIINVDCGECHSVAVNEWGQLFSWGSNSHGQLGMSHNLSGIQSVPKIVKSLATKHVVQVACGYRHCLALINDGTLYAWGNNESGQLGLGVNSKDVKVICQPNVVKALIGVPIAFIACGGHHSLAISKTGIVYGWGKNGFGQLGLNHQRNQSAPALLKTLRSVKIKYISCGEDFSVFLTEDGGVFTCGAGMYGQLGHGCLNNEVLPRKVVELMGSTVTQICCGRRHTLTLIPSRGRVYAFGLGGVGQLGNKMAKSASTPQVVIGPWLPDIQDEKFSVRRIYSGGDHCFIAVSKTKDNVPPEDCRVWQPNTQILDINISKLEQCKNIPVDTPVDQELMSYLELVMSSLSCINGSFLNSDVTCCDENDHGIDMEMAYECFRIISKIEHPSILDTILTCISTMVCSLPPSVIDAESLRAYVILPLYHQFLNPKNFEILQIPFGQGLLQYYSNIEKWYKTLNDEHFELLILIYKNVFIDRLKTIERNYIEHWDLPLVVPLEVLTKLNLLNKYSGGNTYEKHGGFKVPYHAFYVAELSEHVDIRVDYVKWVLDNPKNKYYFCDYPFIFDAEAKTTLLLTDQSMQMQDAMNSAVHRVITTMFFSASMENASISQFLDIHVSRNNIVEDTIRELSEHTTSDLKKPLRVHFLGEEAEDAGGVRKEFFMLVLKDILDPKYGMFQSYEETNTIWFREDTFEDDMFFLIGILCGLAIYNFTIINIPFPLAMYKKLLNEPVSLQDVKELSPTLHKSLEDVLNYTEPDLEEVFSLHFDITRDVFGEIKVFPLKPNGENIPVTLENKKEFVELYVDMILNKSVEARFQEFSKGFHKVCGGRVLQLFHAQELMSVVIGNEDYDWYQLENNAIYKKGYSSSDSTIRMFWEVFHELSLEDKKKFLLYLTGSDRIPIQGMKAIKIAIQPTGDDKYLPVAHTCFNLLDLPRYNTKEKLRYKLLQAIQQTQGFSLV